jgi:hypothetical protein
VFISLKIIIPTDFRKGGDQAEIFTPNFPVTAFERKVEFKL